MTIEEQCARAEIEHTLASCTQAGDARKADAYAESFTENGVLILTETHAGREAIRRWMTTPSAIPQPKQAGGFVSHHLTTCRIGFTSATEAAVRTYWLVITPAGLDHSGYYDDRFGQTGERWLIASRRPRTLWISPTGLLHGGSQL